MWIEAKLCRCFMSSSHIGCHGNQGQPSTNYQNLPWNNEQWSEKHHAFVADEMDEYILIFFLVVLAAVHAGKAVIGNMKATYKIVQPANSTDWRCERFSDEKFYGWINCATWCRAHDCEVFSYTEGICIICSWCSTHFPNAAGILPFDIGYSKFHKHVFWVN